MTNETDGPWHVYGAFITKEPNGDGGIIARVMNEGYQTQRRRAHLLAAAPELRGALEAMLKAFDGEVYDVDDFTDDERQAVGAARAAIKKATPL